MKREFVEGWLNVMKSAWMNADLDAVKKLFTKTTEYYDTPFGKPAVNIDNIFCECLNIC